MSGSLGKSFQIKKYGELSCEEIQHNFCQKYKIGKKKKISKQKGPKENGSPSLESFAGRRDCDVHLPHLPLPQPRARGSVGKAHPCIYMYYMALSENCIGLSSPTHLAGREDIERGLHLCPCTACLHCQVAATLF